MVHETILINGTVGDGVYFLCRNNSSKLTKKVTCTVFVKYNTLFKDLEEKVQILII